MNERGSFGEPWEVVVDGFGSEDVRPVDWTHGPNDMPYHRVVACVNALAGVEDPERFQADVNALVEAANALLTPYHTPETYDADVDALRAALAPFLGEGR